MSEADDVLDFINSLPDSKPSTPQPAGSNSRKSEELLDFLDELVEQDKQPKKTAPKLLKKSTRPAGSSNSPLSVASKGSTPAPTTGSAPSTPSKPLSAAAPVTPVAPSEESKRDETAEADVSATILSWWGSGKGLLGSLASNAQKLSEEAFENASDITNELNRKRQAMLKEEGNPLDHLRKSVSDKVSANADINHLTQGLNNLWSNVSLQITAGLMDKDDELLNILLVYDAKLKYVDDMVAQTFNQAMSQVEGGISVNVTNFNHSSLAAVDDSSATDLNMFYGKPIDGDKLCLANLELSIKDYERITAELEEKQAHLDKLEVNQLNLFVCIQPVCNQREGAGSANAPDEVVMIDANLPLSFGFTVILRDITNLITISSKTQPFPLKWAKWLNGENLEAFKDEADIDPTQWVRDWIREGLNLAFGVLAQEYVIKRMGY